MKKFTPEEQNKFLVLVGGIVGVILLLLAFQAGMAIGYRKASYSFKSGDSFYRVFGERGALDQGPKFIFSDSLQGGHGAAGRVVSVSLPTFIVSGPDNVERIVSVGSSTEVRNMRSVVSIDSIHAGDTVIVLGMPGENGEIAAKLVRIVPLPPNNR